MPARAEEVGEVESALARHPQVRHVRALILPGRDGEPIALACVLAASTSPAPSELRSFVRAHVQQGPRVAVVVVNRLIAALRAEGHEASRVASAAAPDTLVAIVAALWSEVLGFTVTATDDVRDLGGRSLEAIHLMSRVELLFQLELTLPDLLRHPTPVALARWLTAHPLADQVHRIAAVVQELAALDGA